MNVTILSSLVYAVVTPENGSTPQPPEGSEGDFTQQEDAHQNSTTAESPAETVDPTGEDTKTSTVLTTFPTELDSAGSGMLTTLHEEDRADPAVPDGRQDEMQTTPENEHQAETMETIVDNAPTDCKKKTHKNQPRHFCFKSKHKHGCSSLKYSVSGR